MAGGGDVPTIVNEPTITRVPLSRGASAASRSTPVTPLGAQVGSSSQPAPLLPSTQGKTGPGCHPDFTDADKLNARALEPAFENMLRQAEVCEYVIMAIRLQEIRSRQLFAALDRSEEVFCDTCKEALHIDPSLPYQAQERARTSVDRAEHGHGTARHERAERGGAQGTRRCHLHDRGRLDVSDPHVQSEVWKQHPSLSPPGAIVLGRL